MEIGVCTFFTLKNDEENLHKMWSESMPLLIVFRVFLKKSRGNIVFVRVPFFLCFCAIFGSVDPRSARACAVETQFLNFGSAV